MEKKRIKKYILLLLVALLTTIVLPPTLTADIFREHEKVLFIDQLKQVGSAYESYERLKKVREFPVLTGDDETTTDPGIYVVRVKQEYYYSRKYQTPMPYSIFFNYKERAAIHEGEVPAAEEKRVSHPWLCARGAAPHQVVIRLDGDWQNPGGVCGP